MFIVEYAVAAVLKGWHFLLADVFSFDDTQSWLYALILMMVTIRALLYPVFYHQYRANRHLANLRPQVHALEVQFKGEEDGRKKLAKARNELYKENNYKSADGCLPLFIQIPVILGLYRLLINIASPGKSAEALQNGFGPLSSQDVSTFLNTRLFGAPLASYYAMSEEQFSAVGTTQSQVFHVVLPMAILAAFFTTGNWAYSQYRNNVTLDHASKLALFLMNIMWVFGPMMFISPFVVAFGGPGPVAIMIYWVANNLWTAVQAVVIQRRLDIAMPYSPHLLEHVKVQKDLRKQRKAEKKRQHR